MATRAGREIPDVIQNAPDLGEGLPLFYVAFVDLSTDRSIGFGEGPIPWSSIQRYAEAYEFDHELREDLHFLIRQMDIAYLKFRADQVDDK